MDTRFYRLALAVGLMSFVWTSRAATIVWGAPKTISGDSDVITEGTLVAAHALSNAGFSATLNGVYFDAFPLSFFPESPYKLGNFAFTSAGQMRGTDVGFGLGPFGTYGSLSPSYQELLNGGIYIGDSITFTLTMSGLTVGQVYAFQVWSHGLGATLEAGNSVTLNGAASPGVGSVGQFGVGRFVANATSQSINFADAGTNAGHNANFFQLRAVPEPATGFLLMAGGSFLAVRRRHR